MSSLRTFLAGFDFGTTTSACVLASAQVLRNAVNGRMEFSDYRVEYAPDAVFTPLAAAGAIDLGVLESILAAWLGEIRGRAGHDLFGGAIVTGLTARRENAGQISALLRKHVGNVIVATVEDPRLESRLSFAGSAYALSVEHPDRVFVNFDIGGGTTNIAYGRCGEVIDTASLYVGARHAEFRPGTFALVRASEWGQKLGADPDRIVASAIRGLEDLVLNGTLPAEFTQSPFLLPFAPADFVLTFSGGVGELVYDLADNPRPLPRTLFGDLGGELAQAILASPILRRNVREFLPVNRGRATVVGLAIHNQELSGTSVFVGSEVRLPLGQLAVVGRLDENSSAEEVSRVLANARSLTQGAAVWLDVQNESLQDLRAFCARIARALGELRAPMVFLIKPNIGKTLGNLLTRWGKDSHRILVLDEVDRRDSHFLHVGAPSKGVIPIAFYGMG